ncbi:hypothetical protein LPJ53_005164 [Coemansia erecta]|uniref:Phytanoyl-CoA dioxygenase n=1 Tax=Coemansia erecta TaxID=147472 RepID=A0A9W8CP25_9FUNG|nr:hypothetical protein LPJ53_005164 [Coemansia erecta]
MLSETHLETFKRDGCAVIEGFLTDEQIRALRGRIGGLLDSLEPSSHPLTTFATGTRDSRHIGDRYFFESSDKTRYFFDEDAVVDGRLAVDKQRAVNKIGHGLHINEPLFAELTHSAHTRAVAAALGYDDPRVLQSMVIFKQPRIGGAVPLHQDSSFLFTRPPSACGFWIALEDCTPANGCLEVIPGSHRYSAIAQRFVRKQTSFVAPDGEEFPDGNELVQVEPAFSLFPPERDCGQAAADAAPQPQPACVPLEVKAGSLVLIHGQLLHRSSHNHSDRSRWIYTFHIVEGAYEYDARNWLQMPAGAELTKL